MKLRDVIIIGLAIRLAIAPFLAHPYDVFSWYVTGENLFRGHQPVSDFLLPYDYSYFLFIFPATAVYNFISPLVPSTTIQMSSLNPILVPASPTGITLVPGILFDFLVKLPLIFSDILVGILIFKIATQLGSKKATYAAALWLLNPLVIWISSAWGMFDTIPALFTLFAIYSVLTNKFYLSGISIIIAVAMKYYAVVLLVPLMIIAWREGKMNGVVKTLLGILITTSVLFLPFAFQVSSGFGYYIGGASNTSLHSSGLSIWTIGSLFFANFHESLLSELGIGIALAATYAWSWKTSTHTANFLNILAVPIACLLILYRDVEGQFFVWIFPFLAMAVVLGKLNSKIYWILALVVLANCVTNSLLPFYLLPLAPWIQPNLVAMLELAAPFRVAPQGTVSAGLSIGKLVLISFSVICSSLLTWFVLAVRKGKST